MLDRLKNLIRGAQDVTGQHATMRACMMGPRAVGKTTILTAIFHNTSESIAQTQLKFVPNADTLALMNVCSNQLNEIFEKKKSIEDRPIAGIAASDKVNKFHYEFGLKGKKTAIDLEIKDFPGEYVTNGLHKEEVDAFISESNAILLAIDTPHLMECAGEYNEAKNHCELIANYFKSNINIEDEKLILLVPLKCEKYYYEKRMNEVNDAVKNAYQNLLTAISGFEMIACAITPILTIGGVEFDKFSTDSYGMVAKNENGHPQAAYYKFYAKNPNLKPMFCVQPLYYILSYITNQYEDNKKKGNVFKRFVSSLFDLFSSDKELFKAMKECGEYKLKDEKGYEIIQGEELLN